MKVKKAVSEEGPCTPTLRLDGHLCAVHAVAGMLRSVCLTCLCLCYAGAQAGFPGEVLTARDAVAILLALQFHSSLTSLGLSDCGLGGDAAVAIGTLLRENTCIRTLDLAGNFLGSTGARVRLSPRPPKIPPCSPSFATSIAVWSILYRVYEVYAG